MKREDLLKSQSYWTNEIQNELFSIIEEHMSKNKLSRTKLAKNLNVTKGYITQVLSGDFDHKISKMVDLSLSSGKVPLLNFIDIDTFIKNDAEGKFYNIILMNRPKPPIFGVANIPGYSIPEISIGWLSKSTGVENDVKSPTVDSDATTNNNLKAA